MKINKAVEGGRGTGQGGEKGNGIGRKGGGRGTKRDRGEGVALPINAMTCAAEGKSEKKYRLLGGHSWQ